MSVKLSLHPREAAALFLAGCSAVTTARQTLSDAATLNAENALERLRRSLAKHRVELSEAESPAPFKRRHKESTR